MASAETEISAINYQIRRKQTELEHLGKYKKAKTQRHLLGANETQDLERQQENTRNDIEGLEKQIRVIQNREVRRANLNV